MSDAGVIHVTLNALYYAYRWMNPPEVTICGFTGSGKSTLDYFMSTPCDEVPVLPETHHEPVVSRTDLMRYLFWGYRKHYKEGRYVLPTPTRKRLIVGKERVILRSSDLGGHEKYWHMAIEDAVMRDSEAIIMLIDDRDLDHDNPNAFIESQMFFNSMVSALISGTYSGKDRKVRKKLRHYAEKKLKIFAIIANKADIILGDDFENRYKPITARGDPLTRHKIFSKYRPGLTKLETQKGIRTFRLFISARTGWGVNESIKYIRDNL